MLGQEEGEEQGRHLGGGLRVVGERGGEIAVIVSLQVNIVEVWGKKVGN